MGWSDPFPSANSRRRFCFPRRGGIRSSQALSVFASPAAVAEGGRSA